MTTDRIGNKQDAKGRFATKPSSDHGTDIGLADADEFDTKAQRATTPEDHPTRDLSDRYDYDPTPQVGQSFYDVTLDRQVTIRGVADQDEFDAYVASGAEDPVLIHNGDLSVDGKKFSGLVIGTGGSMIVGTHGARIEGRNMARVVSFDDGNVAAYDFTRVELYNSGAASLYGQSQARQGQVSEVYAYQDSSTVASGDSYVELNGDSSAQTYDRVESFVQDRGSLVAYGDSSVVCESPEAQVTLVGNHVTYEARNGATETPERIG